MNKTKGIVTLILTVILTVGLSYIAVMGVGEDKGGSAQSVKLGLDLAGGVSITYQVVGDEEPDATDMKDTIGKLQQRVENYSTEAIVYQEGTDRINIEIPGVSDANAILEELGRPGALYFIAQTDSEGNQNYESAGYTINEETGTLEGGGFILNKTIEELMADGSIVLEGTDVKNAQAGTIQNSMGNSEFVVGLELNDVGTQKFADATTKAYAAGESIAIYYDGEFVSVPNVTTVITEGSAQITGMADFEEAEKLASTIRIGGLKLELEELRSNVVGAQLGEEAISTSIKAGLIGLLIVIIFMCVVYFMPGFVASIALVLYTAMIVILLDGFDMTLTLPGIAGIILSIGMAVDANVIIFARIREELAEGKTVNSAIKIGFQKAMSAIVDGNVTTLIAALVLWFMGSGTVKGFAQTLTLGIALSMFTALVVTKLILNAMYAVGVRKEKWYGIGKERKPINFLGKKAIFFAASLVVIVVGFVFMGVNKASMGDVLNFSMEFKGGTATTVTFEEEISLADIDSQIVPHIEDITGDGNVQTQKVQGTTEVIFKTRTLSAEERDEMQTMLADNFGVNTEKIVSETISSTISDEMQKKTIIAVLVAIVLMLIYIRFRFSDIRFGVSSVAALIHDVLVVLTFYAIAKVSVSSTFIACMLTIVGYSINATIVIFDRVRENLKEMKRKDSIEELVNKSVTQTLSRSIFTSLTTFIMVTALYILGVTSIREFALPLMVGIVCGAYSSVCLTGALWYVLRKKFPQKAKVD